MSTQCWFHDWKYRGYQTIGGGESIPSGPGPGIRVIVGTRMIHFKKCQKCGFEKTFDMPFICYDAIRMISKEANLGRIYTPLEDRR